MNCIIHNDTPAVGSCGKCGCGICSACVQNSIKADGIDKPVCVNCAVEGVGLYVEYLKTLLKATRTKKIVWTAILLVGAFSLICGFVSTSPDAPWFLSVRLSFGLRLDLQTEFQSKKVAESKYKTLWYGGTLWLGITMFGAFGLANLSFGQSRA